MTEGKKNQEPRDPLSGWIGEALSEEPSYGFTERTMNAIRAAGEPAPERWKTPVISRAGWIGIAAFVAVLAGLPFVLPGDGAVPSWGLHWPGWLPTLKTFFDARLTAVLFPALMAALLLFFMEKVVSAMTRQGAGTV